MMETRLNPSFLAQGCGGFVTKRLTEQRVPATWALCWRRDGSLPSLMMTTPGTRPTWPRPNTWFSPSGWNWCSPPSSRSDTKRARKRWCRRRFRRPTFIRTTSWFAIQGSGGRTCSSPERRSYSREVLIRPCLLSTTWISASGWPLFQGFGMDATRDLGCISTSIRNSACPPRARPPMWPEYGHFSPSTLGSWAPSECLPSGSARDGCSGWIHETSIVAGGTSCGGQDDLGAGPPGSFSCPTCPGTRADAPSIGRPHEAAAGNDASQVPGDAGHPEGGVGSRQ